MAARSGADRGTQLQYNHQVSRHYLTGRRSSRNGRRHPWFFRVLPTHGPSRRSGAEERIMEAGGAEYRQGHHVAPGWPNPKTRALDARGAARAIDTPLWQPTGSGSSAMAGAWRRSTSDHVWPVNGGDGVGWQPGAAPGSRHPHGGDTLLATDPPWRASPRGPGSPGPGITFFSHRGPNRQRSDVPWRRSWCPRCPSSGNSPPSPST